LISSRKITMGRNYLWIRDRKCRHVLDAGKFLIILI